MFVLIIAILPISNILCQGEAGGEAVQGAEDFSQAGGGHSEQGGLAAVSLLLQAAREEGGEVGAGGRQDDLVGGEAPTLALESDVREGANVESQVLVQLTSSTRSEGCHPGEKWIGSGKSSSAGQRFCNQIRCIPPSSEIDGTRHWSK